MRLVELSGGAGDFLAFELLLLDLFLASLFLVLVLEMQEAPFFGGEG